MATAVAAAAVAVAATAGAAAAPLPPPPVAVASSSSPSSSPSSLRSYHLLYRLRQPRDTALGWWLCESDDGRELTDKQLGFDSRANVYFEKFVHHTPIRKRLERIVCALEVHGRDYVILHGALPAIAANPCSVDALLRAGLTQTVVPAAARVVRGADRPKMDHHARLSTTNVECQRQPEIRP